MAEGNNRMKTGIHDAVITYDIKERFVYQEIAELLRFVGIFVSEIWKTDYIKTDDMQYIMYEDSTLYINLYKNTSDKSGVNPLIDDVKNKLHDLGIDPVIIDIYNENKLYKNAMTLQYFNSESVYVKDVLRSSANDFKNASDALQIYCDSENFHEAYAYLYCLQRANNARILCDDKVYIYIDELVEKCRVFIKRFPERTNAKVLLGLIYYLDKEHTDECIKAFDLALQDISFVNADSKRKIYGSSVYYWLGKKYELFSNMYDSTKYFYEQAYKCAGLKYRTRYKNAFMHEIKKEWEKAVDIYEDCIKCILIKSICFDKEYRDVIIDDIANVKGDDIGKGSDPLEQEYLFKLYIKLGYIYKNYLDDVCKGIHYFEMAEKFRKNMIQSKGNENNDYILFYNKIYGKDAQDFVDIQLSRMSPKQLYAYLFDAYKGLNMHEKASKYYELYEQCIKDNFTNV